MGIDPNTTINRVDEEVLSEVRDLCGKYGFKIHRYVTSALRRALVVDKPRLERVMRGKVEALGRKEAKELRKKRDEANRGYRRAGEALTAQTGSSKGE